MLPNGSILQGFGGVGWQRIVRSELPVGKVGTRRIDGVVVGRSAVVERAPSVDQGDGFEQFLTGEGCEGAFVGTGETVHAQGGDAGVVKVTELNEKQRFVVVADLGKRTGFGVGGGTAGESESERCGTSEGGRSA